MLKIPLTQNKFALIDHEDFELIKKYKWCAQKSYNTFYAVTTHRRKRIWMHRLIMGTPKKLATDHVNHNGLDNRKRNLRICTASQNQWNRRKKYGGYTWHENDKLFQVRIGMYGRRICVGSFRKESDAKRAYKKAVALFRKEKTV